MKKRLAVIAGLIVGVFISSVGLFGCQGCQPAPELVEEVPETFINETLNFELTDPVPTPTPDVDSYRGSEIENLVVQYAQSYENDDYLKEDVVLFRQWQWSELYADLERKAEENPRYLNTYRLQAEVYLIKSEYQAALAALDNVLRYNHDDTYALGLSAYVQHILGNTTQRDARLEALNNVSPRCHDDLRELMIKVVNWIDEEHGNGLENTDNLQYDAIGILGISPNSDGTIQSSGALRVKDAVKAAYYSPDPKIIISGGAIDTQYSEASVMGNYIVRNSDEIARSMGLITEDEHFYIYGDDVLLDEQARDTVGNAIGICNIMVEQDLHNLLIIASLDQVMRADCIFNAYIDANNLDITVTSHATGGQAAGSGQERYAYVCAASAYGLFTKDDYAAHSKYTVEAGNTFSMLEGKVVTDKPSYDRGETVELSVVPAAGYEVDTVEVETSSGETITVTDGSFVMPDDNVIVNATFKPIAGTSTISFFNPDTFGTEQNGITSIPDALAACFNDISMINSGIVAVEDNIYVDELSPNNALGYGKMGGFGLAASGRIGGFRLRFREDYLIEKVAITAVRFSQTEGHLQVNGMDPTSGELQGEANTFDCGYVVEYQFDQPTNVLDIKTVADEVDGQTNYGRVIIYSITLFLEDADNVDTLYSVEIASTENGTVTASVDRALPGTVVSLEVEGESHYFLDTLKVMNGDTEVPLIEDYTFVMPEGNVTVSATFVSRLIAEQNIVIEGTQLYSNKVAGEVTFDKESYSVGDRAQFTVETGAGFDLVSVTAKTASTDENVTITDNSFIFPNDDVIVTATFKMKEGTYTISFFNEELFGTSQNGITNVANALQQCQDDINAIMGDGFVTALNGDALGYGKHGGFGMGSGSRTGRFTLVFNDGRAIDKIVVNAVRNSETEGRLQVNGQDPTTGQLQGVDNTFDYGYNVEFAFDVATNELTFSTVAENGNNGRLIIYSITIYWSDDTLYSVDIEPVEHGTVTASVQDAVPGTVVSLEVEGESHYFLDTLKVMNGDTEVPLIEDYTFVMPEGNVTVSATFVSRLIAQQEIVIEGTQLYSDKVAGEVTFDKESYSVGDRAQFTVETGAGFDIVSVMAKTVSGENVTITDNSFIFPNDDVVVTATLKMKEGTYTISFFNEELFGTSQNGITNVANALQQCQDDINEIMGDGFVTAQDGDALGYGKHGGFGMGSGSKTGKFTLVFNDGRKIEKVVVNAVRNTETEGRLQVNGQDPTTGQLQGVDNTFDYDYNVEFVFDEPTNELIFSTVAENGNNGRLIIYSITIYWAD